MDLEEHSCLILTPLHVLKLKYDAHATEYTLLLHCTESFTHRFWPVLYSCVFQKRKYNNIYLFIHVLEDTDIYNNTHEYNHVQN